MAGQKEIKQIVRIANVDIDGNGPIYHQLTKVRGVGHNFSNMLCSLTGISRFKRAGELSDQEIERIENALHDPVKFGAPLWMLNRQKDVETRISSHLISSDLKFTQDNDVKIMRKIRSYKGIRHGLGLPVRGQKTKSNFRKNKGKALGVIRSKELKKKVEEQKKSEK